MALKPKIYSYLIDDNEENEKSKRLKKCLIKGNFKFEDYKHCLEELNLKIESANEKKKVDLDNLWELCKKLTKNTVFITAKI